MTVPNFYRLEHSQSFVPAYNAFFTKPLNMKGGQLTLNDGPGLGVELNMDHLERQLHPEWRDA